MPPSLGRVVQGLLLPEGSLPGLGRAGPPKHLHTGLPEENREVLLQNHTVATKSFFLFP